MRDGKIEKCGIKKRKSKNREVFQGQGERPSSYKIHNFHPSADGLTPVQETNARVPRQKGCYYLGDHYDNGERIDTNEPCLNCTCMNSMLMCYLRICPFVKPVGEECIVEREEGDCCPKIWCPEVIKTKNNSSNPNEKRKQYQQPGCYLGDQYYPDGAQLPHDPKRPCEVCYCIRNSTACVMQECELKVDGCFPIYKEGQCCPCRYNCTYEEATPTPPGVTLLELGEGCTLPDGTFVEDGEAVNSTNPCEHCYCMRNEVVCAIQECQAPGDNCRPVPPKPDQCCPDRYECLINAISPNGFEKPVSLTFSTMFTTSPGITASDAIPDHIAIKSKITEGSRIKGAPKKEIVDEIPSPVYKPHVQTKATESSIKQSDTESPSEIVSPVYISADQTKASESTTESTSIILTTETPSPVYIPPYQTKKNEPPVEKSSTILTTETPSPVYIPPDQTKKTESPLKESVLTTETFSPTYISPFQTKKIKSPLEESILTTETPSPVYIPPDQTKKIESSVEESSSKLPTATEESTTLSVSYSQEITTLISVSDEFSTAISSNESTDGGKSEFEGATENLSFSEFSKSTSERIPDLNAETSSSNYSPEISSDLTTPHTEFTTISSEQITTLNTTNTLNSHSDDNLSDVSTHNYEISTAIPTKVPTLIAETTFSNHSNDISTKVTIPHFDLSSPTEIKFEDTDNQAHAVTDYGVDKSSFDFASSTSPTTVSQEDKYIENYSTSKASVSSKENAITEAVSYPPSKVIGVKGRRPTVQPTTQEIVQISSTEEPLNFHEFTLNKTSFNDIKLIEETGVKNTQKKDQHQHTKGKRPQIKQKPLLPVGVIPGESKLSGNTPLPHATKGRPILVNVPGEGNCQVGKKSYKHGQGVPSTDVCKMSCNCSRGKIYCIEIKCEILHPENFADCQIVRNKGECCPHYECGSEVTKSIEFIEVTQVDASPITPSSEINDFVASKVTDEATISDNAFKVYTTTEISDSHYTTEKYVPPISTTQAPFSISVTELSSTTTGYETTTSTEDIALPNEGKIPALIHKEGFSTEISHSSETFETTTDGQTKFSVIEETSKDISPVTEISHVTITEKFQSSTPSVTSVIPGKDASEIISTEAPIKISISEISETDLTDETLPDIDDANHVSTMEANTILSSSSTTDVNEKTYTTPEDLEVKKVTDASTIVKVPNVSTVTTDRPAEDLTTYVNVHSEEVKSSPVSEVTTISKVTTKETSVHGSELTENTADKSPFSEISSEEGVTEKINTVGINMDTENVDGSDSLIADKTKDQSSFVTTKTPSIVSETTQYVDDSKTPEPTITHSSHESTFTLIFAETADKSSTEFYTETALSDEFSLQTTLPPGIFSTQPPKVDSESTTKYQPDVVKTTVVEGQADEKTSTTTEGEEYFTKTESSEGVPQTTVISKVSTIVLENGATQSSNSLNAFIGNETSSDSTIYATTVIDKNIADEAKTGSYEETGASKSTSFKGTTEKMASGEGETSTAKYEVTEVSSLSSTAETQTEKGQHSSVVVTADVFIEPSQPVDTQTFVSIPSVSQDSLQETTSEQGANVVSDINIPSTQTPYNKDHLHEVAVGISVTEQESTTSKHEILASEVTTPEGEKSTLDEEKLITIEDKLKPNDDTTKTEGHIETTEENAFDLQGSEDGDLEDKDVFSKKKDQTSHTQNEFTKPEDQTTEFHTEITDSFKKASEYPKEVTQITDLTGEFLKQTPSEGASVDEIHTTPDHQKTDFQSFDIQVTSTDKPKDKDSDAYTISTTQQTTIELQKLTEEFSESYESQESTTHIVDDEKKTEIETSPSPVTSSSSTKQTTFASSTEHSTSTVNTVAIEVSDTTIHPDGIFFPSSNSSNEVSDIVYEEHESSSTLRPQTTHSTISHTYENDEVIPVLTTSSKLIIESDKADKEVYITTPESFDATSSIETSSEDISNTKTPETEIITKVIPPKEEIATADVSSSVTQDESDVTSDKPFELKGTEHHSETTDETIIFTTDFNELDSKTQSPENIISSTSSTVDKSSDDSAETTTLITRNDITEISVEDQKSFTTVSESVTATPNVVSHDSTLASVSEDFNHDDAVSGGQDIGFDHSDDEGIIDAFTDPVKQTEKPESHVKFQETHKSPATEENAEVATEIELTTTVTQKLSTATPETSPITKIPYDQELYKTTAVPKVQEHSTETDKSESDFITVSDVTIDPTTFYSGTSTQPPKSDFITSVNETPVTLETNQYDDKSGQLTSVKADTVKTEEGELELFSPSVEKEQSTIVTDIPETISFEESHHVPFSSNESRIIFPQNSTEFPKHEINTITTSSPVKENWTSTLPNENEDVSEITKVNKKETIGTSEFNEATISSFRPEDIEFTSTQAEEVPNKTQFTRDEETTTKEKTKSNDFEATESSVKTSDEYVPGFDSSILPENNITDDKTTQSVINEITIKEEKYTKKDVIIKEHDVSSTSSSIYQEIENSYDFSTETSKSKPELVTKTSSISTDVEDKDTSIENENKHSTSFIEQSEETDESFSGNTNSTQFSNVTSAIELKPTTSISPALIENEESDVNSDSEFSTAHDIIHTTTRTTLYELNEKKSSETVTDPTKKYDASYVTDKYLDDVTTDVSHIKQFTLLPSSTTSETVENLDMKTITEKIEEPVSTTSEDSDLRMTTSSPTDFMVTSSEGEKVKTAIPELNNDIKANDMISESDKTLSETTVSSEITPNLQKGTETSIHHTGSAGFTETPSSVQITEVTDKIIPISEEAQGTSSDIQDNFDWDLKVTSQQNILTDTEESETVAPLETKNVSDVKFEETSTDSSEILHTQEYGFHKQTYPTEVTEKELEESIKDHYSTKETSTVTTDKALSISELTTTVTTDKALSISELTTTVTTDKALSISELTTTVTTEYPLLLTEIQDKVSSDIYDLKEIEDTEKPIKPSTISVTTSSPIFIPENLLDISKITAEQENSPPTKIESSYASQDNIEIKSTKPDSTTEISSKFHTTLSISTNNDNLFETTSVKQTFENETNYQTSTSSYFEDKETVSVDSKFPEASHKTMTPQKTDTETTSIDSFNTDITQDYGFHKEVYSPPKHEDATQFVDLVDTTKSPVSFTTHIDDSLVQTTHKLESDAYSYTTSTSISEEIHDQSNKNTTTLTDIPIKESIMDRITTPIKEWITDHITTPIKESITDHITTPIKESTTYHITTPIKESTTDHRTTPIVEITSNLTENSSESSTIPINHPEHASSIFSSSDATVYSTNTPEYVSDVDKNGNEENTHHHEETTISSDEFSTASTQADTFTKGYTNIETAEEEKLTEETNYESSSSSLIESTVSKETYETDKFSSELSTKKTIEQDYLYTTYITQSSSNGSSVTDFTSTSHSLLDKHDSGSFFTEESHLTPLDESKDAIKTTSDKDVSIASLGDLTIPTKPSTEYEELLTTNETSINEFSEANVLELSKQTTKEPLVASVTDSEIEISLNTNITSTEKDTYNEAVYSTFNPDQTNYISSHTESIIDNTKSPQESVHLDHSQNVEIVSNTPDLPTEFSFNDSISDYRDSTKYDEDDSSSSPKPSVTEQFEQYSSNPSQGNVSSNVSTEVINKVTESSEFKNDTHPGFGFSNVTPSIISDVSEILSNDSIHDIISSVSSPSTDSYAQQSSTHEAAHSQGTEKIFDLNAFIITEDSTSSSTQKSISSTFTETDSWRISEEDKLSTQKPITHIGLTEKLSSSENEATTPQSLPSTSSNHSEALTTIHPITDISSSISDDIRTSVHEKYSTLSHKEMLETIENFFAHSSPPSILFEAHKPSSTTTAVPAHKHTTAKPEVETQHSLSEDGYCLYENEVYNSAEQIPRKDPCEFCFCFRGDIICLQQSCPPPIRGCYATPIDGFCCPRFHCPVQEMHFNLSTTTTTTADPRVAKYYLPPSDQNTGCAIEGNVYHVHQVVRPSSGPCMLCRCELGGIMKCDPRDCQPQAPLLLRLNKDFFRKR
ncbi:uncharacterized protein NPIL_577821 [Nephila pilipes]|uniref:VWFC domain-containing protein n=1 Tax=Nephila pilipes TaxID=299642 RepID=A0A8X6MH59_NEPPI|nr:uncharacterized protein NPIL_577821 [Nephila pilipes]